MDSDPGYSRKSIKEYIQFVNVALGSAGENYSQMYALLRSGEISQDMFDEFDKRHYGTENKLTRTAATKMSHAKTQRRKERRIFLFFVTGN